MNSSELPYTPDFSLTPVPSVELAKRLNYETGARHPVEPEISKPGSDRDSQSYRYKKWLEEQQYKRESQ